MKTNQKAINGTTGNALCWSVGHYIGPRFKKEEDRAQIILSSHVFSESRIGSFVNTHFPFSCNPSISYNSDKWNIDNVKRILSYNL